MGNVVGGVGLGTKMRISVWDRLGERCRCPSGYMSLKFRRESHIREIIFFPQVISEDHI